MDLTTSETRRKSDIAVLCGGESEEREVSLNSGKNVVQALAQAGIDADLYDWHPAKMGEFLALGYKKVFIALHGGTGENGMVQAMLEMAGIPFTGARMRAAALCMDKLIAKTIISGLTDIKVPAGKAVAVSELAQRMNMPAEARWRDIETLGYPLIAKPARNGSSVGVTWVERYEEIDDAARAAALSPDEIIIFEQCIRGHELTVAVLNGKALGVCRIIPKTKFYDYEAKYNRDDTQYLTPSGLGSDFDGELLKKAEAAARALDCLNGVARVDFLATEQLDPYFLEVNTVPGMTSHSLVPKIAAQSGIDFPRLCKMIADMAR